MIPSDQIVDLDQRVKILAVLIIVGIILLAGFIVLNIYRITMIEKRMDEVAAAEKALKQRTVLLENENVYNYRLHGLAAVQRDQFLTTQSNMFNTIKETGIFDGKRPKLQAWHCELPLFPLGEID